MSRPRFAQKRDGNHADVVEYLEAHGCEALDLSAFGGAPDLLVRYGTEVPAFIEIKIPGPKANYTRTQLQFIRDKRRFDVAIVTSKESALDAIKNRLFLTTVQRDRIAGLLLRSDKKLFTPAQVREALKC